jgi:hypothetical protein
VDVRLADLEIWLEFWNLDRPLMRGGDSATLPSSVDQAAECRSKDVLAVQECWHWATQCEW